jgi:hypothetical protein
MHLLYGLHDQFTQRSSEQSSGFVILICSSARSKRRKGNQFYCENLMYEKNLVADMIEIREIDNYIVAAVYSINL